MPTATMGLLRSVVGGTLILFLSATACTSAPVSTGAGSQAPEIPDIAVPSISELCYEIAVTTPSIDTSPDFEADAAAHLEYLRGVQTDDVSLKDLIEAEIAAGEQMLAQGDLASWGKWADAASKTMQRCTALVNSQ